MLVRQPYDTLRYIIEDKLNLDFDKNIYNNINNYNHHISYTTSMLQIRNNINNNSIGTWKRYSHELNDFKNIYNNIFKKLNYSNEFIFREISIPFINNLKSNNNSNNNNIDDDDTNNLNNNNNKKKYNLSYYKVNLNWNASIEYDYSNMIQIVNQ